MKKISKICFSFLAASTLISCFRNSSTPTSETASPVITEVTNASESPSADSNKTSAKSLVIYFSIMENDGTDTVSGASRVNVNGELLGNNEYVAKIIQRETGSDIFEIKTVQEYPLTHTPLLEFAHAEKEENKRPELATKLENLEDYDTIFLGYPIWNADLPMPLYSFLEEYDFSGKTIIPFTVHGGSGFSSTIQTISNLEKDAKVSQDGLSISRNDASQSENTVINWVKSLNLQ